MSNIYPQYEEENTRFNNYVVNESGFYILNQIFILHLYPQHDLNFQLCPLTALIGHFN